MTEDRADRRYAGQAVDKPAVTGEDASESVKSAPPACCWNLCIDHQPAHAGLYRGIRDFARAMPGGILSFDGKLLSPSHDLPGPTVRRIACGQGWLSQRGQVLGAEAAHAADAAVANADLLAVHSLFRAHCHWACLWGRRLNRPYWVVPHGCLDPAGLARRNGLKRLWMWRYGGSLFAESNAIIFATRREMAKARSWLPGTTSDKAGQRRRPKSVVVPWPVDLPSLAHADVARIALRSRLGIPKESRTLLWVGRFHASKRPLQAIQAFSLANPPGCHMVIIGVDESFTRADIENWIPQPLTNRIHVLGELRGEALAEVWLAADGYVSLSAKENFSYTAADALAHGVPVILSPGHDLAHELPGAAQQKFSYGWLLPDDSLQAAVQAIKEWGEAVMRGGDNLGHQSGMGESQRAWVAENLSFERFRASLQDLAAASLSGRQ